MKHIHVSECMRTIISIIFNKRTYPIKSIRFYLVVLPLVLTCCNTPGAKKGDNGESQGLVDTVDIVRGDGESHSTP